MTLERFKAYYLEEYGKSGLAGFAMRLERVEKYGTSSMLHENAREVMKYNHAGKDETCLTFEQIVDVYCIKRDDRLRPVGTDPAKGNGG
jgi:hypothetical protein